MLQTLLWKTGHNWLLEQNTPSSLTTLTSFSPKVHKLIPTSQARSFNRLTGRLPAISLFFPFDILIKQATQTNKRKQSETATQANSSTYATKTLDQSYARRTAERKRKHFYNSILNLHHVFWNEIIPDSTELFAFPYSSISVATYNQGFYLL